MPSIRSEFAKNLIKNSLLLLVSIIVAVFLCEAIFRVYEAGFLESKSAIGKHTVDLAALGYNDSTVNRRKGRNEYRILSFGDSFAYSLARHPYSYHGVASSELNAMGLYKEFRVVNLGVPAVSFYQYEKGYDYWGPILEHDAVVFNVYLGNDIIDVALGNVADKKDLRFKEKMKPLPKTVPSKFFLRILDYGFAYYLMWKGDIEQSDSPPDEKYRPNIGNLSPDRYYGHNLKQMMNFSIDKLSALRRGYVALIHFTRMASDIRNSGKDVIIMLSPNETQVTPDLQLELANRYDLDMRDYDFGLSAYLIQETISYVDPDIPVLNLCDSFKRATEEGLDLYYGTNTHWSVEGNDLVGHNLACFMAASWFKEKLPEGAPADSAEQNTGAAGLQKQPESRLPAFQNFLIPLITDESFKVRRVTSEDIKALTKLSDSTLCLIGNINGIPYGEIVNHPEHPNVLHRRDDGISIVGFAADDNAGDVAGGVIIEVNGVDYLTTYGLSRPDVATHFGNKNYLKSGFILHLPPEIVKEGPLNLRIKTISNDKTSYYETRLFEFEVR